MHLWFRLLGMLTCTRPPAAYALRDGDLNVWDSQNINNSTISGYTSVPRVLVSFYDSVDEAYKMNVYKIVKELAKKIGHIKFKH